MNKGKIVIGFLVVALIAVVAYLVTELIKISKASLTYAGAKLNTFSLSKIALTAYFKLNNTGNASVTISNQEYDVYVNGKYVSHMNYSNPVVIAPGENILPLEVVFSLSDVIKAGWSNLTQILTDKSKINISLKGKRTMKVGFLTFSNVEINETFNLGKMGDNATT